MSKEINEKATFAGGCFWCVEAVLQRVDGVIAVIPGYIGGNTDNPTYEQICHGNTGHAEAVEVIYDPQCVSYEQLLNIFWQMHDPTTLNRQGADTGTQYRSAIFYHNESQKLAAETSMQQAQSMFSDPIVTEITTATLFTPAEDYHHNYFNKNKHAGYCHMVITPKLQKLGMDE